MAFTYTGPASSNRDAVRFLCGDTDPDEYYLEDDELDWLLTEWMPVHGDIYLVASEAAEQISGELAREVTVSGDAVSVDMAALSSKFSDLAAQLRARARARRGPGVPEAFGMDAFEAPDLTIKPTQFGVGLTDNDRAGQQAFGGSWPGPAVERDTDSSAP